MQEAFAKKQKQKTAAQPLDKNVERDINPAAVRLDTHKRITAFLLVHYFLG